MRVSDENFLKQGDSRVPEEVPIGYCTLIPGRKGEGSGTERTVSSEKTPVDDECIPFLVGPAYEW